MTINVRAVVSQVRAGLELLNQKETGGKVGELSIPEHIAYEVTSVIVPGLRDLYYNMVALSVDWADPAFQKQLAELAKAGGTLEGFPIETWLAWGDLMLALNMWIATPEEKSGISPLDVIRTRYLAAESQLAPAGVIGADVGDPVP